MGNIARLSFEKRGDKSALGMLSDLDFQPERIHGLNLMLYEVQSQNHTNNSGDSFQKAFTKEDRQLVEGFIKEWDNFEQFQEVFTFLFTGDIMKKHYSDDVLWSDMARKEWVAPDKLPMP